MQIHVVIVTYNRKNLLKVCLEKVIAQSFKNIRILIIDNASTDGTYDFLARDFLYQYNINYRLMDKNLGGAGGFYEGMKLAIEEQAEWIWVMDDDGYPEDSCLEKLYNAAVLENLDAITPLQIDISDHEQLAFPIWINKKQIKGNVNQIIHKEFLEQESNLFNGLLLSKSVISRVGLPRKEFFIRGDEVEYTKRLVKNHIKFGTLIDAKFYHPSDKSERVPIFSGLITTRDAHSDFKNYYMFRNRAVAFIEDGNSWLLPLDFIRYSYYFIFHKKLNWSGLKLWCIATYDGVTGKLGRHPRY